MSSNETDAAPTFSGFVEDRRESGRPTNVLVVGDHRAFPKDIEHVASETAEWMTVDGRVKSEISELESGDVGLFDVSVVRGESNEGALQHRRTANKLRASSYAGLVGHTIRARVGKRVLRTADVRIDVDENGVAGVYQVQLQPFADEIVCRRIDFGIDVGELPSEQEGDA